MPSFCKPSIARRTPRTCPAQRWPWACSASRRYSSRDFTVNAVSYQPLRHSPQGRLRTAFSLTPHARVSPGEDWHLSLPSPAYAVFGDFYQDACFGELGADCIGCFEVAGCPCGLHFGNLLFDVGVGELSRLKGCAQLVADVFLAAFRDGPVEDALHFRNIVVVEHREDLVEL